VNKARRRLQKQRRAQRRRLDTPLLRGGRIMVFLAEPIFIDSERARRLIGYQQLLTIGVAV
jgi:hypothetical protein